MSGNKTAMSLLAARMTTTAMERALNVLLMLQATIDRQHDIKPSSGESQQFAILHAGPARLRDRDDLVPGNPRAQCARDAFVKQHSHRRSGALWLAQALRSPSRA